MARLHTHHREAGVRQAVGQVLCQRACHLSYLMDRLGYGLISLIRLVRLMSPFRRCANVSNWREIALFAYTPARRLTPWRRPSHLG